MHSNSLRIVVSALFLTSGAMAQTPGKTPSGVGTKSEMAEGVVSYLRELAECASLEVNKLDDRLSSAEVIVTGLITYCGKKVSFEPILAEEAKDKLTAAQTLARRNKYGGLAKTDILPIVLMNRVAQANRNCK